VCDSQLLSDNLLQARQKLFLRIHFYLLCESAGLIATTLAGDTFIAIITFIAVMTGLDSI
jgi:hypothetical protein